ncbi:MAG: nucleotidyltransferase domain-containing protein [Candidatus Pacearchaeota archaeon]|nr:nucleotidyltransferase domain-containing protein [Candidatus Pacearchaeota archaeon]
MVQNRDNLRNVENEKLEFEILLVLLREDNHLRNIARILKASHSTIMRKINVLVRENILDYKVEGKNKIFSIKSNLQAKNYIFNAERYKFIKLLKKYSKLNVILEDVLKISEERMIILFGSYAKFIAKEESDIDIYVETNDLKLKKSLEMINSRLSIKIGIFDGEDLLIKEIIKNHVILKGVEEFYEKIKFFR